eukprot:6204217-Pleurochrysis_carterae.AAC.3
MVRLSIDDVTSRMLDVTKCVGGERRELVWCGRAVCLVWAGGETYRRPHALHRISKYRSPNMRGNSEHVEQRVIGPRPCGCNHAAVHGTASNGHGGMGTRNGRMFSERGSGGVLAFAMSMSLWKHRIGELGSEAWFAKAAASSGGYEYGSHCCTWPTETTVAATGLDDDDDDFEDNGGGDAADCDVPSRRAAQ